MEQVRVQVTICVLSHGRHTGVPARGAGEDTESGELWARSPGSRRPLLAEGHRRPTGRRSVSTGSCRSFSEPGERAETAAQPPSRAALDLKLELTEAGVRRENNNSPRCLGRRLRPRRLRPRPRAACPAPARRCRSKCPRHEARARERARPEPPQRRLLSAEATGHGWL